MKKITIFRSYDEVQLESLTFRLLSSGDVFACSTVIHIRTFSVYRISTCRRGLYSLCASTTTALTIMSSSDCAGVSVSPCDSWLCIPSRCCNPLSTRWDCDLRAVRNQFSIDMPANYYSLIILMGSSGVRHDDPNRGWCNFTRALVVCFTLCRHFQSLSH